MIATQKLAKAAIALNRVNARLVKEFAELDAHETRYGRGPTYWRKWRAVHRKHHIYAQAYNRILRISKT